MSENKESEKTVSQSGAYPSETIDSCLKICEQIYQAKGDGFVSREEICAIVGKAEGTMIMRIAACVHYGLLQNHHGKGYQVTDLATSIIKPEFENSIRNKLLAVFSNPSLYKKLIERYNSKPLPDRKGLANILTDFGIHENSTKRAAAVFIDNCDSLNLTENGRLRYFIPNGDNDRVRNGEQNNGTGADDKQKDKFVIPPPPDNKMFKLPIDLGEKTAYLEYPKDITVDEIGELKIMLDAAISALELRKKRNKNPTDA
jgi:hypothetical protein